MSGSIDSEKSELQLTFLSSFGLPSEIPRDDLGGPRLMRLFARSDGETAASRSLIQEWE